MWLGTSALFHTALVGVVYIPTVVQVWCLSLASVGVPLGNIMILLQPQGNITYYIALAVPLIYIIDGIQCIVSSLTISGACVYL